MQIIKIASGMKRVKFIYDPKTKKFIIQVMENGGSQCAGTENLHGGAGKATLNPPNMVKKEDLPPEQTEQPTYQDESQQQQMAPTPQVETYY